MGLPDSYTLKPNSIAGYFDAILNAQPPERFSQNFLKGLGFKSTNDRLLIGVLKELQFLDSDGKPQDRYFRYLDKSQSAHVLAEAIQDAYSDLFAVKIDAHTLTPDEVKDKLRTLYAGNKSDPLIGRIAATFGALCDIADFSAPASPDASSTQSESDTSEDTSSPTSADLSPNSASQGTTIGKRLAVQGLQYHINIVLPDSRDQLVYDAIFKSLREHLG